MAEMLGNWRERMQQYQEWIWNQGQELEEKKWKAYWTPWVHSNSSH